MSDGEVESLRQELKEAKKQLAEWDKELNQLHERNGDLGLEVQNLTEQLKTERADREKVERELSDLKEQLAAAPTEKPEPEPEQKSATASEPPEKILPDAVDLTKKAGELLNLFKSLLPKNTKLPGGTISKIEKILERSNEQD